MATDITTLAIALQSKEAETSLKTFNELLTTGSANAKKMERMSIGVDVSAALKELAALKAGYDDIAKSAANIHFDLGMNMPTAPTADASALEELKTFFQEAAEAMRKEAELVSEGMSKMGAGAERAGESVRTAGETMRGAGASAGEYAEKLREVNAAKKEMEKLAAKADADGQAAYNADQKARAAKHDLLQAERELQKVSEQLSKTHMGGAGDIMELASKEDALKKEVNSLSEAYAKARAEADKFNAKLDVSAGKADEARTRYNQLQEELAGIPKPTGKAGAAVDTFGKGAKQAGASVTKFARGISSLALYSGVAVPKLAGLGRAISMFSITGPYVGGAVVGFMAVAAAIKKFREQSELEAQFIRENADRALKSVQSAKDFISEGESDWKRLGELSDMGSLTNAQNEEATAIIRRLTETYGFLGIEIDKATGKLKGYADARVKATETDQELQRETLRHAMKMATQNANRQLEDFYNSTGDSYVKKLNAGIIQTLTGNGSDAEKQKALNEYKERLQRVMNGQERMTYQTTTYQELTPGTISEVTRTYEIEKKEAAEVLANVEKLEEAWSKANKAKREYEKFGSKELEETNKKIESAQKALNDAESGLIKENGKYRLATDEDASKARLARLQEINKELKDQTTDEAKRLSLRAEYAKIVKTELQYQTRIKQEREKEAEAAKKLAEQQATAEKKKVDAAKEQLKNAQEAYVLNKYGNVIRKKNADELANDRKDEIADLKEQIKTLSSTAARRDATAEELKQWGKRYNPLTGKMDGDQKQSGWRGLLSDGHGGFMTEVSRGLTINGKEVEIPLIVPDSTEEELVKIAKIAHGEFVNERDIMAIEEKAMAFAKKRLAEGKSPFFNGDAADEALRNINANPESFAELIEAQTRLVKLQSEQSQYAEQLKTAQKANEDARKGYLFDKSGAVLRKKTEEELQAERKKELEAARARVKATEEGTLERAQAQAELDRLAIEEYNARKKTGANAAVQEANTENSRLVRGIEARSTEAMALEARSFRRDDSEKAILKDTKNVQTDIKGLVQNVLAIMTNMGANFSEISENIQPL